MTLSQSYSALSRKLYALRGRLSLWLLPASVAALLVTTPFRIADGWILLAVCALLLGSGFALRVRSTAVMLYRTRLRASGNPPAMPFPTEGIYARMRYPLYAGNFLIWFGIVLYTGTDWFVIGATALYAACYLTILGREEPAHAWEIRRRLSRALPGGSGPVAVAPEPGRRCRTGFRDRFGRAPGVPVAGGSRVGFAAAGYRQVQGRASDLGDSFLLAGRDRHGAGAVSRGVGCCAAAVGGKSLRNASFDRARRKNSPIAGRPSG